MARAEIHEDRLSAAMGVDNEGGVAWSEHAAKAKRDKNETQRGSQRVREPKMGEMKLTATTHGASMTPCRATDAWSILQDKSRLIELARE
jgi:hypothetical protein